MRTILLILIASSLSVFQGCKKDDEGITPSDIKNITTKEGEGEIILKWEREEPVTYDYVKISYYDKLAQKTMTRLASSFSSELTIPNTRKKFGEYEFKVQTFSKTNTPGNEHIVKGTSGAAKKTYILTPEEDAVKIVLEEKMLFTNAQEPKEGPIKNLIDNNKNTFFHSIWSSNLSEMHYIQINLPEAIQGFKYEFSTRHNNSNGDVKRMKIEGSNDGVNWEVVSVQSHNLPQTRPATVKGTSVIMNKKYSKLRMTPLARRNQDPLKNSWFYMSELVLYNEPIEIIDPEATE